MNELAPRPSLPCQPIPYGLVSLWDMLRFHADTFVYAMNILSDIDLWAGRPDFIKDERACLFLATKVDGLAEQLESLQLKLSKKSAKSLGYQLRHVEGGSARPRLC